jgi:hypothetical protein
MLISITARDHPCVKLLTRVMLPWETKWTIPSRSRSTVMRKVIFSTTPEMSPIRTTSLMPY